MGQQLFAQPVAHHFVGGNVERAHGKVRRAELFVELGFAKARDRWDEDHDLRQHDEEDRENEQTCRKAAHGRVTANTRL